MRSVLPASVAAVALLSGSAFAEGSAVVRNTLGEIGILDTPSARMAPDGELAFTYGDIGEQQRYSLNFQALPWLEGSFRYSHVQGRFPGYNADHYYDRSFGLKARLIKESSVLPDVSVGVRDILGTGVFAAEYLVASKRLGPFDVTAGMGWGELSETATLSNPLGLFSNSLKVRGGHTSAGTIDFGQFFRGEKVGVFGGVIWQTPIDHLQVLAEYSSDKYDNYDFSGGLRPRSPFSFGLAYRPFSSFAVSAGWMYGNTYGLTLSVSGDPTTTYPSAIRIGPKVPPPALRTSDEQAKAVANVGRISKQNQQRKNSGPWVKVPTPAEAAQLQLAQSLMSETRGVRTVDIQGKSVVVDANISGDPNKQCREYSRVAVLTQSDITDIAVTDLRNPNGVVTFCAATHHPQSPLPANVLLGVSDQAGLQSKIISDIGAQSLVFSGLWFEGNEIWVYYENYRYKNAAEAAGRVIRVLMADAPPSVEIFHLVPTILGVSGQELRVSRSSMERTITNFADDSDLPEAIQIRPAPANMPGFDAFVGQRYPMLSYALDPKLTQRVFDPDAPIQFLIYADAPVLLQILPGLNLSTHFSAKIWSNYSYTRDPGSVLPHVRSDVLKYLKEGAYGISQLDLEYRARLTPEIVGEVRAGYLEDMYTGAGGQVLWRPGESRFAFGADLYQVWKRDFNRLFGTQNYDVLTGHVSVYYQSDWYGLNYTIHAGRYLAGDYGATIEIKRRFESGVEIGAWATFTNVPFSRFGEGSFDKGIIVHIPFEWGLPAWSQSAYDLHLASLTRDGGQRLSADDSLYVSTMGNSYGEFAEHIGAIANP